MYDILKRIIDIVGAGVLLIIFSPIMILTAIAIRLDSSGPIFADTPPRVGRGGKLIHVYKFRSMIPNAQKLLMTDPRLKRLFRQYKENNYKLKDDPRITRVGAFIRRHSIDEFPQFINVLIGNMSLVGPRPYYEFELKEQVAKFPEVKPLLNDVHSALPGITGEWQVSGRSEVDFDKRIQLDAQYARKRDILYDILIMLKTPWAIIHGTGAY
ncbi:MAG: sugar transferase [Patescibacteria group bacterium]|nr:sugar transferase [Patescibacteria group bacterium]MCL5431709.1 sugar transferase [Patescibacteria group bacterium]